jgi:hypothetical protein
MSHKCKYLKLESTSFSGPPSPLSRINSTTELIFTRNRFCGIYAWGPQKFKNSGSGKGVKYVEMMLTKWLTATFAVALPN